MANTKAQTIDDDIRAEEKYIAKENPFFLIDEGILTIKTKKMEKIKLIPNEPQAKLNRLIKALRAADKPVRIWALKARQEGVSTYTEAVIYSHTSQRDNVNSLIMADEVAHSNNLFDMTKLYHQELVKSDPHLAPELIKSNEKKLAFKDTDSQIIIATAENLEAAISHTFQIVHLSEVAYFRDMPQLMNNLGQSVPMIPGSMIIGETTANGMNAFYDEWVKCVDKVSKYGKNWMDHLHEIDGFVPFFLAWYELEEYSTPFIGNELYSIDDLPFDEHHTKRAFLDDEDVLRKEHCCTEEQLNWRRIKLSTGFQEDKKQGYTVFELFKQYYPCTWQEAFLMSGLTFFNKFGMEEQRFKAKKPIAIGNLVKDFYDEVVFREEPDGRVKLYEIPEEGEIYYCAADASKARGLDEASAVVRNIRTNAMAAVINGDYDPEELGYDVALLCKWYFRALAIPENACGYGNAMTKSIYSKYNKIYMMPERRKGVGSNVRYQDMGFVTSKITRDESLSYLDEEIGLTSISLFDIDTVGQHETFIINPKSKKAEAASGKQDGLVICNALISYVRREMPWKPIKDKSRREQARQNIADIKERTNAGISYGSG